MDGQTMPRRPACGTLLDVQNSPSPTNPTTSASTPPNARAMETQSPGTASTPATRMHPSSISQITAPRCASSSVPSVPTTSATMPPSSACSPVPTRPSGIHRECEGALTSLTALSLPYSSMVMRLKTSV